MTFERTAQGLETRLRPTGLGRYFSAAFLLAWLCGWAMGEAFAGWILLAGIHSLFTGQPFAGQPDPLTFAAAFGVALFLLMWLALWTLGGYMAARELLRTVASEDRIVVRADGLTVYHRVGPFRSIISIPRSDLLRVYSIPRRNTLMAETSRGTTELTSYPVAANLSNLIETIREETGLRADSVSSARRLPEAWTELVDSDGGVVLVKNAKHRPTQARVAWIVTTIFGLFAVAAINQMLRGEESGLPAAPLAAFVGWLAWGSWRLSFSRLEWKLDSRRIRYRRRWARRVDEIFQGTTLELVASTDSDGDPWFTLSAVAAGPRVFDWRRPLWSWRLRCTMEKEMDDATNVRRLGVIVAARTGLRMEDARTVPEDEAQQRN